MTQIATKIGYNDGGSYIEIADADTEEAIFTSDDIKPDGGNHEYLEATANRISTAYNCHAELLAALEGMVTAYIYTYGDEGDDAPETIKAAHAAIAKARGLK